MLEAPCAPPDALFLAETRFDKAETKCRQILRPRRAPGEGEAGDGGGEALVDGFNSDVAAECDRWRHEIMVRIMARETATRSVCRWAERMEARQGPGELQGKLQAALAARAAGVTSPARPLSSTPLVYARTLSLLRAADASGMVSE